MQKFVLLTLCLAGFCLGYPASNEQLDKILMDLEKATVNDVAVNAVSEDKKPEVVPAQTLAPSTVEISGISTGVNPAPANPVAPENGGFKPPRTGSMFARIIDDIFQIPITVLQNVAKLITNPFNRRETALSA